MIAFAWTVIAVVWTGLVYVIGCGHGAHEERMRQSRLREDGDGVFVDEDGEMWA